MPHMLKCNIIHKELELGITLSKLNRSIIKNEEEPIRPRRIAPDSTLHHLHNSSDDTSAEFSDCLILHSK